MIVLMPQWSMGNSRPFDEYHDPSMFELDKSEVQLFVNSVDNEVLGDSFNAGTSRTVSEIGGDTLSTGNHGNAEEAKANVECTGSDINNYQNDVDDHNPDIMILSQSGSIDCTILPESQESSALRVERSKGWNKCDGCFCLSGGIDSIKTCSCSFCMKGHEGSSISDEKEPERSKVYWLKKFAGVRHLRNITLKVLQQFLRWNLI